MELFTVNRLYEAQDIVDEFESAVWTERYYGDSEVQIVVPETDKMKNLLPLGIFLGLTGSDELMILETRDIKDGKMTYKGIGLLPWMNNRFVRTSDEHDKKTWRIEDQAPGLMLWTMLSQMVTSESVYLFDPDAIGIPTEHAEKLVIPGIGLLEYYSVGDFSDDITAEVPFKGLYDAMKEIATSYGIGMKLVWQRDSFAEFPLGFRSYIGSNRTGNQFVNEIVRFSPKLESLANVQELHSVLNYKTAAFAFASSMDIGGVNPGIAYVEGTEDFSGFDLRAIEVLADDLPYEGTAFIRDNILNSRAQNALGENALINVVDGDILETSYKYKDDYDLGDIVEVEGNDGIVYASMITEHIRSQTSSGETGSTSVA